MSDAQTTAETFKVRYSAPFGPSGEAAGVVTVDQDQYLKLVSAEPAYAGKLGIAVDMLNSSDNLLLNEPPPEGNETRNQFRRTVARTDAEARAALFRVLDERYGFALTPLP